MAIPLLAQAPTDNVLTNADVVRMVRAGVPDSIIEREIQMSRTDFGTSPSALIELRNQGASERVLGAVLDSRMGTSKVQPEPLPQAHVSGASSGFRPPQWPQIADL